MLQKSDSNESLMSNKIDDHLLEYADRLREEIKKDPRKAICQTVITKQQLSSFMIKRRMQPKEKVGNIIVPSSNVD